MDVALLAIGARKMTRLNYIRELCCLDGRDPPTTIWSAELWRISSSIYYCMLSSDVDESKNGYHGILQSVNRITTSTSSSRCRRGFYLQSTIQNTSYHFAMFEKQCSFLYLLRFSKCGFKVTEKQHTGRPIEFWWLWPVCGIDSIDCNHRCLDMINLHIIVFSSTDTATKWLHAGININYDSGEQKRFHL